MRLYRYRTGRLLIQLFGNLPTRAWLTLRHHGLREFLFRGLTFPLRLTSAGRRLGFGPRFEDDHGRARTWYRRHGRPVTIVIPTYGASQVTLDTIRAVRRTTRRQKVRIVVADDAGPAADREVLAGIEGVEVIQGEQTLGFAGNANRGMRAADGDVVLLNNDVIPHEGWIESLQYAAYAPPRRRGEASHRSDIRRPSGDRIGLIGPMLLYADGAIQSAGSFRNLGAPEWFDHRYRFKPAHFGPALVPAPALALTGACIYIKQATIEKIGLLDEGYPMAYEDVDYCLRCWEAGLSVEYRPQATLTHLESKTRGSVQGERELASQSRFWESWGDWLERREVTAPDGRLRIVYVTEGTEVGGGHRVVFEHLNRLAARGHHLELWSLDGRPDWFPLDVPVRQFPAFDALSEALADVDAIKVATWWKTAEPVWRASVRRGIPVYFVQDIETSYYAPRAPDRHEVMATYREEFHYLTTSTWVAERLREVGVAPTIVAPGVDLDRFRPLDLPRADNMLLALGRSEPLKNFGLTMDAWESIRRDRPELWLFGSEPDVARNGQVRYFTAPSDEQVNELYNQATVFVQTSRHEGFCLPLLEAMATGAPVVCTDADGNRDFCRHEENCLLVESDAGAVSEALRRAFADPELRRHLGEAGRRTAEAHGWEGKIDELERFYASVAAATCASAS